MKREIIKTKDNSLTFFVPELNQHYHSIHGALQESKHVFIEAGIKKIMSATRRINILEVGFGTGLNAFLTLKEISGTNYHVKYYTAEKYPLHKDEYSLLDYPSIIDQSLQKEFENLHKSEWERDTSIADNFILHKKKGDIKNLEFPEKVDLIYYDAFAPSAQNDLWSVDVFTKMYDQLNTNGILVTYCVKGEVRRNMKAAGFQVEKIPGPPGKREMARAYKLS